MSLPLDAVRFGKVRPAWGEEDIWDRRASLWMSKQIGFYPQALFFAKNQKIAAQFAGYTEQWRTWWHDFDQSGKIVKVQQKKGAPRNRVLAVFTVDKLTKPVFIDSDPWCQITNEVANRRKYTGVQLLNRMFKRSWNASHWLRYANKHPYWVWVLAPFIDLRVADQYWVRNHATRRKLEAMGFKNVKVRRFPVRQS
jgi:hypothetical protein